MAPVSPKLAFPRRAKASEERRRRVLEAATDCFGRYGFQKTSVDRIAKEAGVSKGLVLVFFGTKEALFDYVLNRTLGEWWRASEDAAVNAGDAAGELRALFMASFIFLERHPRMGIMLDSTERSWMTQTDQVVAGNRKFEERLAEPLRKGIEDGTIRADIDVESVAEIIHELQSALVVRQMDAAQAGESFDLRLPEDAIRLMLEGLRCRHPVAA
jgi:AcrR family transcriptional regulator